MPQEEKDSSKLTVLKSVFLSGSVNRMKDIEELYPTYTGKLLGMNHSVYIKKLNNPALFTIKQILFLAEQIDIKPEIIINIILKQLAADKKKEALPPKEKPGH